LTPKETELKGHVPSPSEKWIDDLIELLEPKLEARGFTKQAIAPLPVGGASSDYDASTCEKFLSRDHISESVLVRARKFFSFLDQHGEIGSLDVVGLLDLKGPTSIPANLTNPLKKSAKRLGIEDPWQWGENAEGTRTIWNDRDGIAARMVDAIDQETERRKPFTY
jgi:hypothetical protein